MISPDSLSERAHEQDRHREADEGGGGADDVDHGGARGADVTAFDGAADAAITQRRHQVREHAEAHEGSTDPGGADPLRADRELTESRDLAEKDAEAGDGEAERHEGDPGADPGEHGALVRLMETKGLLHGSIRR